MIHELKILPQYFVAVQSGEKTFELRKNDRDFKVGDTLVLKECSITGAYSGKEITKEVSYILDGGQYGLKEGYCILGLKQEGITLQNIDLTGISTFEQLNKVKEEHMEFMVAIELADPQNAIEEFHDDGQAKLGLLEKIFGITAQEVMEQYPKHLEKLKHRPRKENTNE